MDGQNEIVKRGTAQTLNGTEVEDGAVGFNGQLYRKSPFLLQRCHRASSIMDLTEVQSYELLRLEDICHTKHWISFV